MIRSGSWTLLGVACLLAFLLPAYGGETEGEAAREIWHFEKGRATRAVDVTVLPAFVREAIVKRLAADGYTRRDEAAKAPRSGRDLREDARTLARHGGRFPRTVRGVVLGARVVAMEEKRPSWAVMAVPAGSLAAALGLVRGDRILAADGARATRETLAAWEDPTPSGGQRTLRLLRRDGRSETWRLRRQDCR